MTPLQLLAIWLLLAIVFNMSRITWLDPNWRHQLSNAVIAWMVIGALGLAGAAIYYVIQRRTPSSPAITINCQIGPMPSRIPSEPEGIWGVDLSGAPVVGLTRYFSLNPAGADADWGLGKFAVAERCEAINYGESILHEVALQLQVTYLTVVKSGKSGRSGGVHSEKSYRLYLPIALAPRSGKFSFYIWNHSEWFADAVFADTARAKTLSDEETKDVEITIVGSRPMFLQPRDLWGEQ